MQLKPGFARNEQRPGLSLSQQRIHPLIWRGLRPIPADAHPMSPSSLHLID
jgi:hypothetical protein